MQATWIVARGDALRRRAESPSDTAIALAIANAIAPSLRQLPEDEADAHVNMCLGVFLAREVNRREYVVLDDIKYAQLRVAPAAGVEAGIWHGLPLLQNLADFANHNFELTTAQSRLILQGLLANMSPPVAKSGSHLSPIAFISFAKRGEITARKLNSIMGQLRESWLWCSLWLKTSLPR